ncbi:MAG TPA: four helix bundle protein, partial [Bacteroidales bacterium]|nr:four helix bundle protein [Bacteroidales bacterium]
MKTHRNLEVWNKSVELVTEIYKVTESFPKSELYGLTNQIRRSAVSIPSNIAEGAARASSKELLQFLSVALGSVAELETQLIVSGNLNFIDKNHLDLLLSQIV